MASTKVIAVEEKRELDAEFTDINEKALVRKLDIKLLPALTLLYLMSFLDRSNVANARIEGLVKDLHITGNQYLTGLTIFFIGYVLFEVPCNIVLKRTSPRAWLPTLTFSWAVVATLLGMTQNFSGFLAARFFLGVTESGLFPGAVFYLSMWYKRNEQHFRIALFFSAASLAGAFGGILAWEGILTAVIAVGAYFFINNYPATAKFLSEKERAFIHARLKADNDATQNEAFTWTNVSKAFKDHKVWLYGLGFHTLSLPLYTLSLFLPTIIKELGYTAAQAQLMTVPPYSVAFVMTLTTAVLSERYRLRAPFIIADSALAIIGYIILLSTPHGKPGLSYFGTILAAAGIYPATAIVLSWPANNVSGQTKRATANAMQISIGNLGAVLGTQLYRTETRPRFFLGHGFAMGYLCLNMVVVVVLWGVLRRENARRDEVVGVEGIRDLDEWEWEGDEDLRWKFQT
ncbi:MAG: hypothetical protein Q9219_000763 [cf. Caloplaca sp. 3 TL-2023]